VDTSLFLNSKKGRNPEEKTREQITQTPGWSPMGKRGVDQQKKKNHRSIFQGRNTELVGLTSGKGPTNKKKKDGKCGKGCQSYLFKSDGGGVQKGDSLPTGGGEASSGAMGAWGRVSGGVRRGKLVAED